MVYNLPDSSVDQRFRLLLNCSVFYQVLRSRRLSYEQVYAALHVHRHTARCKDIFSHVSLSSYRCVNCCVISSQLVV